MKIYNIQYGPSMMVVTGKDPSGSFPKGLSLCTVPIAIDKIISAKNARAWVSMNFI